MNRLVCLILVTVANALPTMGASSLTDVTPKNVASQPLALQVIRTDLTNFTVNFDIYVSSGAQQVSSSHEGRFAVWWEKFIARSEPTDGGAYPLAHCRVYEYASGDTLRYEVNVTLEMLDRVTFTFYNYSTSAPRFDAYQFILWEFPEERK